jgi:hypothetical protein
MKQLIDLHPICLIVHYIPMVFGMCVVGNYVLLYKHYKSLLDDLGTELYVGAYLRYWQAAEL